MNTSLRPIETRYKGYRFRSRLEARWAVFFEHEGIKWEYEPEGYRLGDLAYLPDFWLPQVSMFAEVKPTAFTEEELEKCRRLVEATGSPVLLLDGPPDVRSYFAIEYWGAITDGGMTPLSFEDYVINDDYLDEQRFYYVGTGNPYPQHEPEHEVRGMVNFKSIEAARVARFEHGETP